MSQTKTQLVDGFNINTSVPADSLVIDSSGRLLVGQSTPDTTYRVTATGYTPKVEFKGTDVYQLALNRTDGACYLAIASKQTASSGNGVGGITFNQWDGSNLLNAASITAAVDGTPGANDMPGRLIFSTTADSASSPTEACRITNQRHLNFSDAASDPAGGSNIWQKSGLGLALMGGQMAFYTGTTERMRIANNGDVNWTDTGASIPTNNVGGTTVFGSNGALGGSRGGGGKYFTFYQYSNSAEIGSIQNNSGTGISYNISSDYRLKENSIALNDGIERVKLLNPLRFNFIANPEITVDGFFAHEVQDVVPEAISGQKDAVNEDGSIKPQGIDQSKLVPLLTAALQEAIAKIETLEAKVAALEAQ